MTYRKKDYTIREFKIRGEIRNLHFPCFSSVKKNGELNYYLSDRRELVNKDKYGTHRKIKATEELNSLDLKDQIIVGELCYDSGKDLYSFLRNKKSEDLVFYIFDIFYYKKLMDKLYVSKEKRPLKDRIKAIESLFKCDYKHIRYLEHKLINSKQKLKRTKERVLALNEEGIVVKNRASLFPLGNTKAWAKFKAVNTADLAILGYRKDRTMSFLLGYKQNGKIVKVGNCGSGLNDQERTEWKNKLSAIKTSGYDKDHYLVEPKYIIEVKYEQVIKNGSLALKHPRYITERKDKNINDTNL